MSVKHAFFGIFQKIVVICCAIFFGFANAFSANLPSGYTELEYIESTGTQVIDSGTLIKRTSKIVLDAEITRVVGANAILAGNASSSWATQAVVRFEKNNVLRISANTSGTVSTYDTERHTYTLDINNGTGSKDGVVFNTFSNTGFSSTDNWQIFGVWWNNKYDFMTPAKLYSVKIYDGDTLVRDFVPAKQGNTVGMYDTVNNVFYTNAGTGEFTAGPEVLSPCRNLFDGGIYKHGQWDNTGTWSTTNADKRVVGSLISINPNTTYTMKINNTSDGVVFWNYAYFDANKNWLGNRTTNGEPMFSGTIEKTFNITDANARYFAPIVAVGSAGNTDITDTEFANARLQIEEGSTATAYVPYNASCHNPNAIKIATTAYNTARFSPVVNDLNSTVATIREIVTNTINQTAAIASLQADKQTRPEDACPAGKKCLLVETEENGVIVPHWFPIIEAPEDN